MGFWCGGFAGLVVVPGTRVNTHDKLYTRYQAARRSKLHGLQTPGKEHIDYGNNQVAEGECPYEPLQAETICEYSDYLGKWKKNIYCLPEKMGLLYRNGGAGDPCRCIC
jgi:hypothetical protein